MKKVIVSLLLMGAFAFGLTACGDTSSKQADENNVQEKVPEYKELVDPRGKTLESTATGESSPQIVETVYETKDVVVADYVPTEMGYAVDPTGATDSTAGIQQALYDCYNAGGGTVYLPVGNYAISDTIYIPPYVTLHGDWQDPDEGTEYGTIISVWMESEDSEGVGAFKLGSCSGAVSLTVYYPLQTMDCIMPYPYTFYVNAQGVNKVYSAVKNVTIINGYRGIGTSSTSGHESIWLENIKGTFLCCGLGAANESDVGFVTNLVVSNKYWKEAAADCMNAVRGSVIDAYTKKYTTGLQLGDLEWTTFNNISVDNCAIGIHVVPGVRIEFVGTLYDVTITNCAQGVVVDGLDSRWGAIFARSYIEGGFVHNVDGVIKLCDVEIVGGITEKNKGSVVVDETDLSADAIDYDKSYNKPAANLVVADIPNGLYTDAGPDLQKAIDEVAVKGGGVVYVPGGTYRFKTPVTVPTGVELRGSSAVASRDIATLNNGTVFLCYYGDDASNKAEDLAFITLAGENAGLSGIRIVYPENGPKSDNLNTTYTVRGTASNVYVVNCMISASAYGIDFSGCDNHYIEGVVACCYNNTYRLGGTGGVITRCMQNGSVLVRTSTMGLTDWYSESELGAFHNMILRKTCDYIIVEDATDQLIYCVFGYGVKTPITNINSENTFLNNIGNDNIATTSPQIYVDSGSVRGINILRYNGYSYEFVKGSMELYNRIAINEVGEKSVIKDEQ